MTEPEIEREMNAQILYEYGANVILPMLKAQGVWIAPSPAPLPAEIVRRELERLALADAYKEQRIVFCSEDGYDVILDRGVVEVGDRQSD